MKSLPTMIPMQLKILDSNSLKALCGLELSGKEHMILRCVEYWLSISGDSESKLSNSQICDLTGIGISHAGTHLNALAKRKIIDLGKGHCRTIKLNPNLDEWQIKKGRATTISKPKPVVSSKIKPTAKAKTASTSRKKEAGKTTPEWFKGLWGIYPVHRRGGNYACSWKKWQSMGLAEQDAKEAMKWLVAAAKNDSDWSQDATSGFAVGITKFIDQTHWRIPVPTRQAMSGPNRRETEFKDDGAKIEYCDKNTEKEWGIPNLLKTGFVEGF